MKIVGKHSSKSVLKKLKKQHPHIVLAIMENSRTCVCLQVFKKNGAAEQCDIRTFFEDEDGVMRPTRKGVRLSTVHVRLLMRAIKNVEKAEG